MKVNILVSISLFGECKIILFNGNTEFGTIRSSLNNSFNFSLDKISTVNIVTKKVSKTTFLQKNLQSVLRKASMLSWVADCLLGTSSTFYIYFSRVFKKEKLQCKIVSQKHEVTSCYGEHFKKVKITSRKVPIDPAVLLLNILWYSENMKLFRKKCMQPHT